jgi:hypothetical protein
MGSGLVAWFVIAETTEATRVPWSRSVGLRWKKLILQRESRSLEGFGSAD